MSPIGSIRKIGLYFRKYIFFLSLCTKHQGCFKCDKGSSSASQAATENTWHVWRMISYHTFSKCIFVCRFVSSSILSLSFKVPKSFWIFYCFKRKWRQGEKSHKLQSCGSVNMHKWLHGGQINRLLVCCIWCRCYCMWKRQTKKLCLVKLHWMADMSKETSPTLLFIIFQHKNQSK